MRVIITVNANASYSHIFTRYTPRWHTLIA